MIVYAVRYSNYEPPEVDSLWLREESANKHRDNKNAQDEEDLQGSGNWEVTPLTVNEDIL